MTTRQLILMAGGGTLLFAGGVLVGKKGGGSEASSAALDSRAQAGMAGMKSSASGGSENAPGQGAAGFLSSTKTKPLEDILRNSDPVTRQMELLSSIERASTEELKAMFEELKESGFAEIRRDELMTILTAWATRDPVGASEYVRDSRGDDGQQFTALAAWARVDPAAAEQWARANHEGDRPNDWLVGVIQGLAETDPTKAGELLADLPPSRERWSALRDTLPYVMELGDGFARDWVAGIEDGRLQSETSEWMATRFADKDPETAARWVESLGTPDARREASEEVALRYARQDLGAAQNWVSSLPENTRTEAAEGIVSVLANQDPRAAIQWLERLGDDPDYDGAWVDLVNSGFRADPGVALVGALRLSNEDWRRDTTMRYLGRWMREDEAAARQWAQDYQEYLPEQVARRFLPRDDNG